MNLTELIDAQIRAANDVRTAQADVDREAFAREKRGYARRLRELRERLSCSVHSLDVVSQGLARVIADLERSE